MRATVSSNIEAGCLFPRMMKADIGVLDVFHKNQVPGLHDCWKEANLQLNEKKRQDSSDSLVFRHVYLEFRAVNQATFFGRLPVSFLSNKVNGVGILARSRIHTPALRRRFGEAQTHSWKSGSSISDLQASSFLAGSLGGLKGNSKEHRPFEGFFIL